MISDEGKNICGVFTHGGIKPPCFTACFEN